MNTQGFYKYIDDELFFAQNFVSNANYELLAENHENYVYPIDGWSWFDSEADAKLFFNIEIKNISV